MVLSWSSWGCNVRELLQGFDGRWGETKLVADCEVYCVYTGVRRVGDAIAAELADVLEEFVIILY